LRVFVAGGTGFLGSSLIAAVRAEGHEVTVLARPGKGGAFPPDVRIVTGDPTKEGPWQRDLKDHDAVINLTGASIFQPWSKSARRDIVGSRIYSTKNVVEAIRMSAGRTRHLLNASGIGYYGFGDDTPVDERAGPGVTFLAGVARSWEEEALRAREAGARVVLCRLGIVLGRHGGAFTRMLPLVRFHLGAIWGTGKQWFSWIHEDDCARIFAFLLDRDGIEGAVNFVSPGPVTNTEMMRAMNHVTGKRPYVPAVPGWLIRLFLGEFSTVFLEGQRAVPGVLQGAGFTFHFPLFREAVADLTGREGRGP
jgi:uncharacterized protein